MGLPDIENIPDTGAVFTLGKSRFADNIASHFFIRKDPVVSATCGDEHSAVVCQSGRLFVFGSNTWGQLGLGHKNHVSKPSCVKSLKPEKVTHVACGRAHTLICTDNQKIFSCGSDQENQLGRANLTDGDSSSSPVLIYDCGTTGKKIVQIVAGTQHSLALTSDGGVLAWGSNLEGQLGLPDTSGLINKPTEVPLPEAIKQISAGYYHSAFLTESGVVYVCGETESGKLGISLDFMTQVAPKQMQLKTPVVHVACGGHHTLVLGEDGNIYGTGSNVSGQLGLGLDVTEIQTPKQIICDDLQAEKIIKIGCGESHIAVVTESGKLFTCGDGRHGKLGLEENENNVHELTHAIKYQELFITDVACGGCHTILVGRRRGSLNGDGESTEMKISALPPLKLPVSRLQNEIPSMNTEENNKANEMEENERNNMEEEKSMDGDAMKIDEMKSLEKPESPKKSSEFEESMPIESTKLEEDSMMSEKTEDVDHHDATAENHDSVDDDRPKSSASISKKTEETNHDNVDSEETMIVEKPECPPLPVPPPKPPRQKSTESDSSSHHASASSSRKGSVKSVDGNCEGKSDEKENPSPEKLSEMNQEEENKNIDELEKDSDKKSVGSDKSQSSKSKADTDDTIPIETTAIQDAVDHVEDVIEKTVDKVEEKIEMIADDADVVASPITRTGKMAKLFKSKKQEVENVINNLPNPKAKSKTCSIL